MPALSPSGQKPARAATQPPKLMIWATAALVAFVGLIAAPMARADDDELDRVRRLAVGASAAETLNRRAAPDLPPANIGPGQETLGQEAAGVAAEAEAQKQLDQTEDGAKPFGARLFQGQFARNQPGGLNPDYVIAPGDQISVNIFGARTFNELSRVDAQGNLFVPEVGPVPVGGVANRDLQATVEARVSRVFTDNVKVYVNLLGAQTLGVFVTGAVVDPGRYSGLPTDSMLAFIDKAGGIDLARGSFRNVQILRRGQPIASADLYDFLTKGALPTPRFENGDVILIKPIGGVVSVSGEARVAAAFEFLQFPVTGRQLAGLARPTTDVSHVALSGFRAGRPFNTYVSYRQFLDLALENGDLADFQSDLRADDVFVQVEGEYLGAKRHAIARGARLESVLDLIAVDPNVAATESIYLRRDSVARDQKRALDRSLDALERTALAALSQTESQAAIRGAEAQLVLEFVRRARSVQPDGRVVVSTNGTRANVRMEPGDEIVIPQKTDLILISGEVELPQSVAHVPGADIDDYVDRAGGYGERADSSKIIVIRASGEAIRGSRTPIMPGDQILVLPIVDFKAFAVGKDIIQVMFQVAIIAATIVAL